MDTPNASGGAGYIPGTALDMTDPKDQATLRKFQSRNKRRFAAITEDRKARWVAGLDIASNIGEAMADCPDEDTRERGAKLLLDVAKTGGVFESMNMKDDHKAIDVEHGTGVQAGVSVQVVIMPPASVPQVTIQAPAQIEGNA